jgi:chromate transporter
MPPSDETPISQGPRRRVSKSELFSGFLKIGLMGFGGVAPYARHVIVEERRWLTEAEYAEVLGVGQILPGPNTMNAGIIIGDRFQGSTGAVLCALGQILVPLVIVVALALAYDRVAQLPLVSAGLDGAAAAAAGLAFGTGAKIALRSKLSRRSLAVAAAGFAAIGLLRWPLIPVVLLLAPLSVLMAKARSE